MDASWAGGYENADGYNIISQHGGVCATHAGPQDMVLTAEMADALVNMAGVLPRDMKEVRTPDAAAEKLLTALIGYLENILQKPLKSAKFVTRKQELGLKQ